MAYYYKRKIRKKLPVTETMDFSERWMSDGIRACTRPGLLGSIDVDMTLVEQRMSEWKSQGHAVNYPALFVRCAAIVLAKEPQLHVMRLGYRRFYPEQMDIALSVAGQTFISPLLIIKEAQNKSIFSISEEITREAPHARERDQAMARLLRRWGWIVPCGWMRRLLLRFLFKSLRFRRSGSGTFQVTYVPDSDLCVPYVFSASALMGCGRIVPRVVAHPDGPAIRPMMTIICSADHATWDGLCANLFLKTVKKILESGEFADP